MSTVGPGARHRQAGRAEARRPTWRSRSTPPPTRSATGSCRSTRSGRSRRCSTPPRRFPLAHGRRITFEYVLLAGRQRQRRRRRPPAAAAARHPAQGEPHPVEPVRRAPLPAPVRRAHPHVPGARCAPRGLPVYIRTPRGDDIDAACGQLAARELVHCTVAPRMSAADDARRSTRARHRRLRPHRRVLGLHAHDGAHLRPAVPVARAAAPGGDPDAPRHLGGQRVDDAGGAAAAGASCTRSGCAASGASTTRPRPTSGR